METFCIRIPEFKMVTLQDLNEEVINKITKSCPPMYRTVKIINTKSIDFDTIDSCLVEIERLMDEAQYLLF